MNNNNKILVINPGSTSTKISIFEDEKSVLEETVRHDHKEIDKFENIFSQFEYRLDIVNEFINKSKIDLKSLDAVVGRGGNMKPVEGGTYKVNEAMIEDLKIGVMGQHASNLGGILANEIAKRVKISSYVVDPVIVDEFEDFARISGIPEIKRKSKDHPLSQKAAARKASDEMGGKYEDFNFITVHLGGGISVGMHRKGKIIDVNNCLDGDGPFSPERSGGLPVGDLIELCYSGKYSKKEMRKKIVGGGGLVAYLGTKDGEEIAKRINNGDEYAELIYKSMAYQVSKEIGAAATVLCGDVDKIILTGGLAFDKLFTGWVTERIKYISDVIVYPGGFEMLALVQGVLRVLKEEENIKIYQ
jgi:butyrate kinase